MLEEEQQRIKTFAILDVEVNDYAKFQFNQCSLTELCLYAVSTKCLQNDIKRNGRKTSKAPKLPRVLHKLNLIINPMRRIHDHTRTGLDNYMLEDEPPFDTTTADCILKFLDRLQKPVCLVAHNGRDHDYPLIHHVYSKLNQIFPSSIYFVDSLHAFRKIDADVLLCHNAGGNTELTQPNEPEHFQDNIPSGSKNANEASSSTKSMTPSNTGAIPKRHVAKNDQSTYIEIIKNDNEKCLGIIEEDRNIDRQHVNETTPKNQARLMQSTAESNSSLGKSPTFYNNARVKRRIKFDNQNPTKISYTLGKLYESVFTDEKCGVLHQAEADVSILTKLLLHYGVEFVKYAEANKQSFDKVHMLGAYNEKQSNED